ncbi:MAG TPA: sulfatase [Polyangiaceae bacterium]|nr:sulfatase [Polyangiaceae bacterium]
MAGTVEVENARGAASEASSWFVLGVLNAGFVALLTRAPGAAARAATELGDLGLFSALGLLCGLARLGASTLTAQLSLRPALAALASWPIFTLAAYWVFKEDLSNFLERMRLPAWLPARLLLSSALAAGYVVFRQLTRRARGMVLPWVAIGAALGLVAANNLLLPVDYPGAHLLLAACAARLAELFTAFVSDGLAPRVALRTVGLSLAAPALGLAFLATPAVLQRLLRVPGSVVPPLLLPLLGQEHALGASWSKQQFPSWFQIAESRDAIPPSGSQLLDRDSLVIFLTIDALRADVVAAREHDDLLPELAELREQSVRFRRARSPSPSTLTTVSSIFSGRYYSQLYWVKKGDSVLPDQDQSPRWPALLAEKQIRTVQVVAVRGLSANTGVGIGFDTEVKTRKDYGPAGEVMDKLLEQLEKPARAGAFLYAHFVDSHAPYTLGGRKGSPFERYLAEVALVDRELGRLRNYLKERDLARRTLLIVSADHGEAFGEHGLNHHAQSVYDELLRVPLLMASPKLAPRDIDAEVSLIDIGPTVLDLFQLPTPGNMMGQSLVPLLSNRPFVPRRPIVADSGRRIQALIFPDGVKAIRDLHRNTQEVYDLRQDPGELTDRSGDPEFPSQRYTAGLAAFFEQHTLRKPGWEPPWRKF